MGNTLIRDAVVLSVCVVASAVLLQNRHQVYELIGLDMTKTNPAPVETEVAAPKTQIVNGSVVSIPKNRRDGQFWTDATVNSGHVNFLVDTGASTVALTLEDARKAGLKIHELDFDLTIQTAGGANKAAPVTLKSVSVGPITLRNVQAIVVKEGLNISLLGMTYLGELQRVEATQNSLILRL